MEEISLKGKIQELLQSVPEGFPLSERIEFFAAKFLGSHYAEHPLSDVQEDEELRISLESFDCVTFCEEVLALAFARNEQQFKETLKALRYFEKDISWKKRKHYMSDWTRDNAEKAFICDALERENCTIVERELSCLDGYPSQRRVLKFLPVDEFLSKLDKFQAGDIVFFGTTRENLDVAHLGFLVKADDGLCLRHASKEKGGVVDESLGEFFERFGECPGIWVFRPVEKKE